MISLMLTHLCSLLLNPLSVFLCSVTMYCLFYHINLGSVLIALLS